MTLTTRGDANIRVYEWPGKSLLMGWSDPR
jgi:hypothetical protein